MRLTHRLLLLRYGIPPNFVLNSGPEPDGAMAPEPAATDMRRIVNALKAEAFDTERGRVDYSRLCASPTYAEYCLCARRLQSFDPAALGSREKRLAFWINLYNALIVDGVIQFAVKRSVNEAPGFFWRAAYNYALADVESYCFRHTVGDVRAASPATRAAIVDDINAGIKAGQCACDLRNPQGSCCLGNVRGLIEQAESLEVVQR
jgi:hypothetical protein